jgi:two-component system, NarL family, sensor histidine kinase BarA
MTELNDTLDLAELRSELAAAYKTIEVLIERSESAASIAAPLSGRPAEFDSALMLAQILDEREREVVDAREQLRAAQAEFRALTSNLDQIVKQRTRALEESEDQLRERNRELQTQGSLKAEFISIVAHELRTPLTSIVGYLDLFAEKKFGETPQPMVRPLGSLRRNAHRLKRLVDEMLDVSRIEAGRMVLHPGFVKIEEVLHEVATELSPLAQSRRQTVRTSAHMMEPLWADHDKLYQIVVNLLSNAIRYTPDGGEIEMIADQAPEVRYPGGWVRIRVRDNGIGIEEEHRNRIFEPFYDVQPARHHSSAPPGSSGLGLYIARGLIELHGGLISVDSVPDKFTEFTVLLPRTSPLNTAG